MVRLQTKISSKLLSLSLTLAVSSFSLNTHAATITATADYKVGTSSIANNNETSKTSGVSIERGVEDSSGNSIFYHSSGNQAGSFRTSASGAGTYDLTSSITYVDTVMNTSGSAQNYTFDFNIAAGQLSVSGEPNIAEFVRANYSINIFVNGSSVFSSAAAISLDNTVTSFNGDSVLSGTLAADGRSYSWSDYFGSIDLGPYAAGESLTFEYIMTTRAYGNAFADASFGCGIECGEVSPEGSTARIGDPINLSGIGGFTTSPVTSVPEASSLLLLTLGLTGLGFRRKKYR